MFKKGAELVLHMAENGSTNEYYVTVLKYEDGLLYVEHGDGEKAVYNVHSRAFIKAEPQG